MKKETKQQQKKYAEYKQTDKKLLPECKHHDETMKFRLHKICRSFTNLSVVWTTQKKIQVSRNEVYLFIHSFILCTKTATQLYIQLAISRSMYLWKWSNSAYGTNLTHELLNLDIWIRNPIHWNRHMWLPSKTYECQ